MTRGVRRILGRLDVGVYRPSRLSTAAVDAMDATHLPEVDCVVDVGVAYGTGWLYERFPHAQLVLVDPVPNPALDRVLSGRPHTFVECAVGSAAGTADMTVELDQSGASSLLDRTDLTRTGGRTATRSVDVRTLDDVAAELIGSEARVGLKLDVEGYELEALRGAEQLLRRCAFVVCEASVLERFAGSYRFEDLVLFMRDAGFTVDSVLSAERDPAGRIRFLDLAFVPSGLKA
jgi:FkbM family methyltransferase